MPKRGGWCFSITSNLRGKNPPAIHQSPNSAQSVDSWALPLVALIQKKTPGPTGPGCFGVTLPFWFRNPATHGIVEKRNCVVLYDSGIYTFKKPGTRISSEILPSRACQVLNFETTPRYRYMRQMSSADQLLFS